MENLWKFAFNMSKKVGKNITSVIFDLGGVLFDINYSLTQKAFIALGINDFVSLYSQQKQSGVFDEFEKGNCSPAEFRSEIKKWLPTQVNDRDIDSAWNAMLLGVPPAKKDLLSLLGKRYRLFLLSNTNEIHLPAVLTMIKNGDGEKGVMSMFEKCYYSCRMGMRKPDKEIFDKVCLDNELPASDTLFIDDSIQNVEGAKLSGLATLHCTPFVNLAEYFG